MKKTDQLIQKNIDFEKKTINTAEKFSTLGVKALGILLIFIGILFCITLVEITLGIILITLGFLTLKFAVKGIRSVFENERLKQEIRESHLEDRKN